MKKDQAPSKLNMMESKKSSMNPFSMATPSRLRSGAVLVEVMVVELAEAEDLHLPAVMASLKVKKSVTMAINTTVSQ